MAENLRYNIFDNNIISDVFGEEVVLVNLESGVYYSLRYSATQIWIRLFNQYSPTEIFADLIQIYQVDENDLINLNNILKKFGLSNLPLYVYYNIINGVDRITVHLPDKKEKSWSTSKLSLEEKIKNALEYLKFLQS